MSQDCGVPRTSQERFKLPKSCLKGSIIQHFEALLNEIENLNALTEESKRGPIEDTLLFQGHAEIYRSTLSKQWQTLSKSLGWQRSEECDGSVSCCKETGPQTPESAEREEDKSLVIAQANSSAIRWETCPVVIRDQVAYIFQAIQGQRLQMEALNDRIAELEERYDDTDASQQCEVLKE